MRLHWILLSALPFFGMRTKPSETGTIVRWLSETEHHFGEVRQGYPVKYTFRGVNISDRPILLQTVRTTCGCTAAEWTEEAIPPGDTASVRIEYDTFKQGAFRKKVMVFFDAQRKPEVLWVSGMVH